MKGRTDTRDKKKETCDMSVGLFRQREGHQAVHNGKTSPYEVSTQSFPTTSYRV